MRNVNTVNRKDARADATAGVCRDEARTWDAAGRACGREPRCPEAPAENDDRTPEEAGYGYGV